jgi:hypothetical protein
MTENADYLEKKAIDHIRSCPSCSRAVEALEILQEFMVKSKDNPEFIEFDKVRNNVISTRESQTALEKIIMTIKNQYIARPKLITGLSLAVIMFLVVTLVPFGYQETIGYNIALCCVEPENAISEEVLETALTVAGYVKAEVELSEQNENARLSITNLPDEPTARHLAATVSEFVQAEIEPKISEIKDNKKSTLYKKAVKYYQEAKTQYAQADESYKDAKTIYAQAVKLRNEDDKDNAETKPIPLKLKFENEQLIINNSSVTELLYSKTMTDEEIQESLRELIIVDGIDPEMVDIEVVTLPDISQRDIRISATDKFNTMSDDEELVEMGISVDDAYLKIGERTVLTEDGNEFELDMPSLKRSLNSKGLLLKIMLDNSEELYLNK